MSLSQTKLLASILFVILINAFCPLAVSADDTKPTFSIQVRDKYYQVEELLKLKENQVISTIQIKFHGEPAMPDLRVKDLPLELLEKLASFKAISDLVFEGLSGSPTDQGSIDISGLTKLQNVERLTLRWVRLRANPFITADSLPRLKEIMINDCDWEVGAFKALEGRVALQSLIIDDYFVPAGELRRLPQLKLLVLKNIRNIEQSDERLFNEVVQLPNLESLSFEFVDGSKALRSASQMPRLKKLAIREAKINDSLLNALINHKKLEELDLSDNSIQGIGLKSLRGVTSLTVLKLADNPITDEGLSEIAQFKQLVELDLHNQNVGHEDPDDYKRAKREIEKMHQNGRYAAGYGPVYSPMGFAKILELPNLERLRLRDFRRQPNERWYGQLSAEEMTVLEKSASLKMVNGKPFKSRSSLITHLDEAIRLEQDGKYEESLVLLQKASESPDFTFSAESFIAFEKAHALGLLGRHDQARSEAAKIRVANFHSTENSSNSSAMDNDRVSCSINGKIFDRQVDEVFSLLLRYQFFEEALELTEERFTGYKREATAILRKAMVRLNEGKFQESEQLLESVFVQLDKENTRWGEEFEDPIFFRAVCQLKWLYLVSARYAEANQLWLLPYDRFFANGRLATARELFGRSSQLNDSTIRGEYFRLDADAGNKREAPRDTTLSPISTKSIRLFNENINRVAPSSLARVDLADQIKLMDLAHQGKTREALAISDDINRRGYIDVENKYHKLGDLTFTALFLRNRAVILRATGDLVESEKCLRNALQMLNSRYGMDFAESAITQEILSRVLADQGKAIEAEQSLEQAIFRSTASYGSQHPHTAELLHDLADIRFGLEKTEQAIADVDQSRRIIRDYVSGFLTNLPESEQDSFLAFVYTPLLSSAIELSGPSHTNMVPESKSLEWVLNGKAVAAETRAKLLVKLRQNRYPALTKLSSQISDLRQQRIAMEVQSLKSGSNVDLDVVAALVAQENQLFRELTGKLPSNAKKSSENKSNWISTEAVQGALSENEALVEIVRYSPLPKLSSTDKENRKFRYQAWTMTTAGKVTVIDLGPADEIDRMVGQVRRGLAESPNRIASVGEIQAEKSIRQGLKQLADKILSPLLPYIGDSKTWTISPDGNLWLIPWAALPVSESEYAIENHAIRYVVSGRELILEKSKASRMSPPVIVADPDFDSSFDTNSTPNSEQAISSGLAMSRTNRMLNGTRVVRLPGTASEAQAAVVRLESMYGEAPKIFLAKDATSMNFRASKRPRAVLLSTHGFFLDNQNNLPKERKFSGADNPLLRCGLLFAGCNQTNNGNNVDYGVLTGLDIVSMDLSGTELVVLSACETGLGDIQNGEGVAGLRQAFQLAGANSIAATLWQIPDLESALLMEQFFDDFSQVRDAKLALQQAQVKIINRLKQERGVAHPYFWSAYTLTGQ